MDPPWEEYARRCPANLDKADRVFWSLDEIMNLEIDAIADNPSFIFLWVGSSEGLDQGRLLLKKWGFRRCEDICWIKTNNKQRATSLKYEYDKNCVLTHTKEHCLMGIKGTVRRNVDGHLIHANIDTDVMISEEPPIGDNSKPEEMYHIIEHFSLGRRRIEIFAEDHNIRKGWLSLGLSLSNSNFSPTSYKANFENGHLLGTTSEIESLRPKSPPRTSK